MIEHILEQQPAICGVLVEDRRNWHKMPSDQEFTCLEAVASVLKPLSLFTYALSGEKCVTISAVLPLIKHINQLLEVTMSDCRIVKEMEIVTDLTARYSDSHITDILETSSYFDPRFRLKFVDDSEQMLLRVKTEATSLGQQSDVQSHTASNTGPPAIHSSLHDYMLQIIIIILHVTYL